MTISDIELRCELRLYAECWTNWVLSLFIDLSIYISLWWIPMDTVATPLTTAAAINWFLGSGLGISLATSPTWIHSFRHTWYAKKGIKQQVLSRCLQELVAFVLDMGIFCKLNVFSHRLDTQVPFLMAGTLLLKFFTPLCYLFVIDDGRTKCDS